MYPEREGNGTSLPHVVVPCPQNASCDAHIETSEPFVSLPLDVIKSVLDPLIARYGGGYSTQGHLPFIFRTPLLTCSQLPLPTMVVESIDVNGHPANVQMPPRSFVYEEDGLCRFAFAPDT